MSNILQVFVLYFFFTLSEILNFLIILFLPDFYASCNQPHWWMETIQRGYMFYTWHVCSEMFWHALIVVQSKVCSSSKWQGKRFPSKKWSMISVLCVVLNLVLFHQGSIQYRMDLLVEYSFDMSARMVLFVVNISNSFENNTIKWTITSLIRTLNQYNMFNLLLLPKYDLINFIPTLEIPSRCCCLAKECSNNKKVWIVIINVHY